MAWMIDGNKLKEKAVQLLFPTEMEPCGHLPDPVQAVTVSTIEDMLYRDGIEVVRCKDCKSHHWEQEPCHGKIVHICSKLNAEVTRDFYCAAGERKDNDY